MPKFKLISTNKVSLLVITLILMIIASHDNFVMTTSKWYAAKYEFNIIEWELKNISHKWWIKLTNDSPQNLHKEVPREFSELFCLQKEMRSLYNTLNYQVAQQVPNQEVLSRLSSSLHKMQLSHHDLSVFVEPFLEDLVENTLKTHHISHKIGPLNFPPVDISFSPLPKLLVTSPRSKIVRQENILLVPAITMPEIVALENNITANTNLSVVVVNIGGIATYPAIISALSTMPHTLDLISHEWLHHYLAFTPLGQNMLQSHEMLEINETLANIFGEEISMNILSSFEEPPLSPTCKVNISSTSNSFDFNYEMAHIRRQVDHLLAQGLVEQAEVFMEEKRLYLLDQGYPIRKLNQAYFAFHGTYTDQPFAINDTFERLLKLRKVYPTLRAFIRSVSQISSYKQFLQQTDDL